MIKLLIIKIEKSGPSETYQAKIIRSRCGKKKKKIIAEVKSLIESRYALRHYAVAQFLRHSLLVSFVVPIFIRIFVDFSLTIAGTSIATTVVRIVNSYN